MSRADRSIIAPSTNPNNTLHRPPSPAGSALGDSRGRRPDDGGDASGPIAPMSSLAS
jgi:hypothetical protein